MANFECQCCGGLEYYKFGNGQPAPTMCFMCRARGGLCLHNLGTRSAEGDYRAHSSRSHWDDSGAADPASCRWCQDRSTSGERMVGRWT